MNFAFTEEQEALRSLVHKILSEGSPPARLTELERSGTRYDEALWHELRRAIEGIESFTDVCIVLEQAGRTFAAVPAYPALLVPHGDDIVTFGRPAPYGMVAGFVLGPDGTPQPVASGRIPVETVSKEPYADLGPTGSPPVERVLTALAAVQCGVSEAGLRITAEYVSAREQFGRPLGSFQAVQQRIADACVDLECMRWTMWQAAWRIDAGLDAETQARIAKFWAADAGPRIAATAQQLHGGIGVDLDYPVHRCLLWTKQIELTFGSAPEQLEALGARYR
jgi:hypothetical protein